MSISDMILPLFIGIIIFSGLYRGIPIFDTFLKGAKEGLSNAFSILPSIIGLYTAVCMLRASGAIDLICHGLSFLTDKIGFPSEVLPLALLRPVSGGASVAVLSDVLKTFGPDSFPGKVASVIAGSTETTFYTMTVYFAATRVKDTRYTLKSALLADLAGILFGAVAVRLLL
ncbi:MAG: spore maturation protein [Clostridia bacterium]|nr:spore maturation protein [Clostridia bacterium]